MIQVNTFLLSMYCIHTYIVEHYENNIPFTLVKHGATY